MIKRPIELSHDFLAEVIDEKSVVVDATMGNGYDTLFLAQKAGCVYAFDIQKKALERTRQRLEKANCLANVNLILDGHEKVARYVTKAISAAIFNLGYLPSADKSLITKPATTLSALSAILEKLQVGGRVSLMVYYGHEGGDKEKDAVLEFVESLSQEHYATMLYQPLNQINTPPFLIMIEKLR
ncbi:class I SAM-dependent methyltransferase [Streptococcus sp. zg-JUN1979]|uniref:class I SAM-dependent methyltransferase n=1 Tax=Streptococcus sp. zg-JUN1979 TaxID=3391450 RepID=UPI0039A6C552